MNVTLPEQEELPGYVGLALGGLIFGMGTPGLPAGAAAAEPYILAGGLLGLVSALYLAVLFRVSATVAT